MLDFYLQFIWQLEKLDFRKCYYIVHNWIVPVLDHMCIDEGNIRKKITQWSVKNFHNTNELEDTLVLPYNEWNH
jgi:hypothetical protein